MIYAQIVQYKDFMTIEFHDGEENALTETKLMDELFEYMGYGSLVELDKLEIVKKQLTKNKCLDFLCSKNFIPSHKDFFYKHD